MHSSLLAIGLTLAAYSADHGIQREIAGDRTAVKDDLARVGEKLGNGVYVIPALAGTYLAGRASDDARLRSVGRYGLESFVASGVIAQVVKQTTGRHRPNRGDGRDAWDGPRLSNSSSRLSFPSGHATTAFAMAATVSEVYKDEPGVAPAAYGLATLCGLSRIYANRHWASDVVAGAALGTFTAKYIVRLHDGKMARWRDGRISPVVGIGYMGIQWQRPFSLS